MTDDIARLVRLLDDQGPSHEFVTMLRERVVEESRGPSSPNRDGQGHRQAEGQDIGIVPPRSSCGRPSTRPLWLMISVAAAALFVAAAVGLSTLRSDDEVGTFETIDQPDAPEPAPILAAALDPDATPLTEEYSQLTPDTYRIDTVGTPFTVTLSERFSVEPNSEGFTVIAHRNHQANDDRDIVIMRPSALVDPIEVTASLTSLDDGWPAVDFEGWLDAVDAAVGVTNRQATTLGGRNATRFDVKLDPDLECPQSEFFCISLFTNNLVNSKRFRKGSEYRVWFVDQDGEDPIAFIAAISDQSDRDWFDTAEAVLETVAFGEVAPNPMAPIAAGRTEQSLLGGVAFDAAEGLVIVEDTRGFLKISIQPPFASTQYLVNPFDPDGEPVATSDDLLANFERYRIEVSEGEPTTVGRVPTRVFDLTGGVHGTILKLSAEAPDGWYFPPPSLARIWSIEHPERGLLLIIAWAGGPDAAELHGAALAQATDIIESLEFIELGR